MIKAIRHILQLTENRGSDSIDISPLSAQTHRVSTRDHIYFCKSVPAGESNRLVTEASGLKLLREHSELTIPRVYGVEKSSDDRAYILIDWIDFQQPTAIDWACFGRRLARMHQTTSESFGLDHNNYIGLTRQINAPGKSWFSFFVSNRLLFQRDIAQKNGLWRDVWSRLLDRTISLFEKMIPSNIKPSLCHGDLWSGNCGFTAGSPSIFDPAVYYGHYEVDLAMTRLFGGFPFEFYNAYHEINPEVDGTRDRCDVYNLYHLINHLNIFGKSYEHQVDSILNRMGS
ncbi:MAG: phosphotransferase [Rhodothermales bacterium]|nr:phosphotransferase [Rhodothermales bacterium]